MKGLLEGGIIFIFNGKNKFVFKNENKDNEFLNQRFFNICMFLNYYQCYYFVCVIKIFFLSVDVGYLSYFFYFC